MKKQSERFISFIVLNFSTRYDYGYKKTESLLGGGKTEVNVQVIDNVGVNANVRQEGNNILIELISQKIANDYADGSNGWASAIAVQQQSSTGLSISR